MKIWIDLANSPQVLFFRPLIAVFKQAGHEICITTRNYSQTVQLADQFDLAHTPLGAHGGRGFIGLLIQNLRRAGLLLRWARGQRFDLALSHNAYSQIAAAKLLGIRAVTAMDYEHQPLNQLAFRLARRVIVPEVYPEDMLRSQGALHKSVRYAGIKEEMYLAEFKPTASFKDQHGLPQQRALVVIRPPANWTAYHRFENELFTELLSYLNQDPKPYYLFLARLPDQQRIRERLPGIQVAQTTFSGPDLLYNADVLIGASGTMNREAAVLGTPAYTLFQGKAAAVDQYLIDAGRLTRINHPNDFDQIALNGGQRFASQANSALVAEIARHFLAV